MGGGWNDFLGERFSYLAGINRFVKRDSPLPSWSDSDVQKFIESDPVHGPTLKAARDASKFAAVGSVIGALQLAGFSWRYSKSLHGAGLSLAAGAVFGWTFGQQVGNHWFQLYKLHPDPMTAQIKFLEWWEKNAYSPWK